MFSTRNLSHCLALLATLCFAQTPLIRESIGTPEQDRRVLASYYTASRLELSSWAGKTFIFLPRDSAHKNQPYQIANKLAHDALMLSIDGLDKTEDAAKSTINAIQLANQARPVPLQLVLDLKQASEQAQRNFDQASRLFGQSLSRVAAGTPYEVLAGRQARAYMVEAAYPGKRAFSSVPGHHIFLALENGDEYVITTDKPDVADGIALLSDIELGRRNWRGLQVHPKPWMKDLLRYDADTGHYGSIPVSDSDTLTVTDVVAGFVPCAPARVILSTSDAREGFQDVAVSKTNCPPDANFSTFVERFDVITTSAERK